MLYNLHDTERLLDDVSWSILRELQADARLSYAEIGRRIGMSPPAVMERIRKLEDAGVIRGYRADIDLTKLGLGIHAIVRVANSGIVENQIVDLARETPEVIECHHITGADCFDIHIATTSIPHLERVLTKFSRFNQTTTSLILSTPVQKRIVTRTQLNYPDDYAG